MSGHTPGPWAIQRGSRDSAADLQVVADQGLVEVCTLRACPGVREEQRASTARLIATAPLMLTALREVQKYLDAHGAPASEYTRQLVRVTLREASGSN